MPYYMIIIGTKMHTRISHHHDHLPVWYRYSLYNWKLRTSLSDWKRARGVWLKRG